MDCVKFTTLITVDLITPSVVRAYDAGESARAAIKLLASVGSFTMTQSTHSTVRDYIVSQLATGNALRTGVLVNMTIDNVRAAVKVDNQYVVRVCTQSVDEHRILRSSRCNPQGVLAPRQSRSFGRNKRRTSLIVKYPPPQL